MSASIDLRVGMRLSVAAPDGALSQDFVSTVRRVDRRGLLIDIPRRGDEDLMLNADDEVTLFAQLHGRLFHLETRVIEADLQVLLEEPQEATRTERREFYRLLTSIDQLLVELLPIAVDEAVGEPQEAPEPVPLEASIVDLSGGGVRLRLAEVLEPGRRLRLTFEPDGEPLTVEAEVVRVVPAETRQRAQAQCRFVDIARGDQERIIRFIFEKQREYSQRGVA